MARWIERARGENASSPSNWILRHVDRADQDVVGVMLKAISGDPPTPPSLQLNLLRGLCRSVRRQAQGFTISDLSALSTITLGDRRKVAPIPDGATTAIKTCAFVQELPSLDERLLRAREHFDGKSVWLDDQSLSDPKSTIERLRAIGHADFIGLKSYWANAAAAAQSIKNLEESIKFLFLWLETERGTAPRQDVISHLLTAAEILARHNDEKIVAAVIDPDHWEPILAEWAEFLPHWWGRMAAISLLGRLRRITSRTAPALLSALQDVDLVQLEAFKAAQRFRSVDGDILSGVLDMLDSQSTGVAASAAQLLTVLSQKGDGEFLDLSQVFRRLQQAALHSAQRGVYLQLDPTHSSLGFSYIGRIDHILRNSALSAGRF